MTEEKQMLKDRVLKVRAWRETDVTEMDADGLCDVESIVCHKDGDLALYILPIVGDGVIAIEVLGYYNGDRKVSEFITLTADG